MKYSLAEVEKNSSFIVRSSLYVTLLMVFFLLPFGVNNFLQGRDVLGFGATAIIILCAINAWNCAHDKFQPFVILFGVVPFITVFLILSLRQQGLVGIFWSYPAALSFYFMLPGRLAWFANAVFIVLVIPESWAFLDNSVALRYAVTLITASSMAGIFMWFISKQQYKLHMMAILDPLTGLYNRSSLDHALAKAISQYQKKNTPMTLLMFDLDHFKSINDTLGHYAGDTVLTGIGRYFKENIRASDKAFRIGGEEFIVLMKNTTADAAQITAEKIRADIAQLPLITDRQVTTSIGVSEIIANDTQSSWMKRCDINLYQAKMDGRNRVVVS